MKIEFKYRNGEYICYIDGKNKGTIDARMLDKQILVGSEDDIEIEIKDRVIPAGMEVCCCCGYYMPPHLMQRLVDDGSKDHYGCYACWDTETFGDVTLTYPKAREWIDARNKYIKETGQ